MISKMSVIAFTAGLVAALCVTDVNAVVWETCKFSDSECKNVIEDSCLGGKEQPDGFADYYQARQDGNDDDSSIAPKDFKTCKQLAKAYNKANDDDEYDDKKWLEYIEEASGCQEDPDTAGEYYGQRCGASFTGSSMAALFGLLCVSLALW